jgi:hypothetical protein
MVVAAVSAKGSQHHERGAGDSRLADIAYVNDKLRAAVTSLATGRGRIQERLAKACEVGLWAASPSAFSNPDAASRCAQLIEVLFHQRRPVADVIQRMDEAEAARYAQVMVDLQAAAELQIRARLRQVQT